MATKQFLTDADFEDNGPLKPVQTGVLGRAGDLGLSVLKGTMAVPEFLVGVANIPTGGKAGKAVEQAGVRFKDAKQILDDQMSVAGQLAQRKYERADGFTGKVGAAIQNPSIISSGIAESVGPMGAGMAVGRGLMAVAPRVLGGLAGAIGEGVVGAGSAAEQIRQQTADGELTGKQAALAGATGLATTAFGALGNKIGNKLGVGDIDNALIGGAASQAPAKQAGLAKRVAGGAFSEGVLEELPQSVSEQMLQNVALNQDPMQGVDSAAAMGLVTGGAMGAGFGILNRAKAPAVAAEQATGITQPGQNTPTGSAGPTLEAPVGQPSPTQTPPSFGTAPPTLDARLMEAAGVSMPPVLDADRIGQMVDLGQVQPGDAELIAQEQAGGIQRTFAPKAGVQPPISLAPITRDGIPFSDAPERPSVAMGLDPAIGGLTAAAAIAVDSGVSPAAQTVTSGMGLSSLSGSAPAAKGEPNKNQAKKDGGQFDWIPAEKIPPDWKTAGKRYDKPGEFLAKQIVDAYYKGDLSLAQKLADSLPNPQDDWNSRTSDAVFLASIAEKDTELDSSITVRGVPLRAWRHAVRQTKTTALPDEISKKWEERWAEHDAKEAKKQAAIDEKERVYLTPGNIIKIGAHTYARVEKFIPKNERKGYVQATARVVRKDDSGQWVDDKFNTGPVNIQSIDEDYLRSGPIQVAQKESGPAAADTQAAPAAVTSPASDVRARNLAALKARMMGQKKLTPTTPPAQTKATPAPEAGPTNQGATNGQGQETLLKAEQPTGAAAMVSGAPVAGKAESELDPKSIALQAAKIRRRESPETANPRIDPVAAQESYLQNIARSNPEQAAKVASELRANKDRIGDAANVPGDIVGRYAKIIEQQLALASKQSDTTKPVSSPVSAEDTARPITVKESQANKARRTDAGYTQVVRVNAQKLTDAYNAGNPTIPAMDSPSKISALTKNTDNFKKPVDSYPLVTFQNGAVGYEDGRHRVAAAIKRGGAVEVAMRKDEADAALKAGEGWIESRKPSDATEPGGFIEKAKKAAGKVDAPKADKPQVFKTAEAADYARAGNPAMQKRKVKGGYILVERTAKQIAAAANNARKNFGKVNPDGGPLAAHQYIASEGGIAMSAMADLGFDRNLKVGSKFMFTKNGMTLERMTEALQQAGYMDGTNQNEAIKLVSESAKGRPQYTADGWEQIAQADANVQFEDFMAVQEEMAQADDFDPFDSLAEAGFLEQDADSAGFYEQSEQIQNEISALQSSLESMNIDPVEISDSVHRDNPQATQDEFYARYKAALQQAIDAESAKEAKPASSGSSRQDAGGQSGAGAQSEGLTSPTRADIEAQQARAEQAAKAKAAQDKADAARAAKERERKDVAAASVAAADTFELGQDAMANLTGQQDVFGAMEQEAKPVVSKNTIFTEDAAAKARARLKSKLGRLNSGLDPEMMMDGITLAGYHIEKGARTFAAYARAMIEDLGDGVKPYLKSWYMGVKYDPRAASFDGMDGAASVEAADINALTAQQETQDVPSPNTSVERDSRQPATEPAVGDVVQDGRRPDAAGGNQVPGQPGRSDGGRQPDGVGVPADGPVIDGIGGNLSVHSGDAKRDAAVIATGAEFSERGSGIGNDGVSAEPVSTGKVAAVAQSSSEKNRLALKQKQADSIGLKYADLDNIKATLPMLLDGQQEDVFKAETRFQKLDGYGMLFTNGTGTGKTFTGLGIIKRMERQGKTNILVVVPDEKIGDDWIGSAKLLGLNISKLADTKDAGKGVVLTTYANLGSNDALANRAWDLVVADEAHNLMKSADGTVTTYLQNLRAITMHPDGAFQRYAMLNREKIDRSKALSEEILGLERMIAADSTTDQQRAAWDAKSEALQKELGALRGELDKALSATRSDVKASQGAKRTRLAALSATPFAYEFTIDWANGYLFDYNDGQASDETESRGYNSGSNRERFFMQHFGYSMRYNKLTKPDPTKVDTGLMQRSFNTMLKKAGSLSGRMLDVKADYDRRFVLVDSAIGNQIDEALNWISDMAGDSVPGFSTLRDVIGKKFDYLSRRYLLEAIKAKEAVPIVRKHMEMGRKVVVFHDYKKGGGFNPFNVSMGDAAGLDSATEDTKALAAAIDSFKQKFAALVNTPFQSLLSPIEVFRNEFPGVLLINGDEKKADLLARYKAFQDDATGPQVALVQSAKNAGWSGHDTTGKHQRVLINLGQPTAPTLAIQQEGRIYRTGQVSNAIMRYMNTGTNWEKWAFATTIAGRASAAENLGMGELSRALKDSFIGAFEESDAYPPGHEGEGTGGKERDAAQNNQLTAWDRAKSLYWATQKKNSRTKAQEGVDYFATPEPVGMKMAEWLGSRGGERTLEPSAGHGAIARWLPETTKRTVIEPSNTLRSRLALVMNPSDDRILDVKFEALDAVNKFDGIAMNPPFGVGGKTAIDHMEKAATHLADGGRIVALIPTGPAADKRFDQWMYGESVRPAKPLHKDEKLGEIYQGDTITFDAFGTKTKMVVHAVDKPSGMAAFFARPKGADLSGAINLRAATGIEPTGQRTVKYKASAGLYTVGEVLLPAVTFERAGTAVSTRIVVLEKQSKAENAPNQKGTIDLSGLSDINDLFDRMENLTMPERKMTEAQKAEVEAEQKQAEASTAKTERNEAAKKQSAAVGDKVTLAGKEYDVVVYTTNAGKEIRGAWVKTKELATRFNDRTFQKKPLGWFVREKDFPRTDASLKPSLSRSESQSSPRTPAATIRSAITKAYGNLLDKLEGKGLVTIAQTEREAIEAAAQARADKTGGDSDAIAGRMMSMAGLDVKYSANGNIEGFFDKQTGKSFLVADNLTAASAPGTLMHEVGIHMAADGKLEPLFKRAGSLLNTGTQNEFIQRVKARMARAGETSDEEAAAYIVTEYENDRAKAPITIGKWLADLTAAVRAWLFGKGVILKADQLTVADIAAVARANARSMARGGQEGNLGDGQMFSRVRSGLTKVRGGWTKEKIRKELKGMGLGAASGKYVQRYIAEFDSAEEFADHIFYHGTGGYVSGSLRPSIVRTQAEAERGGGGGYGERYWAISVSRSKEKASGFTGQSSYGSVYPVILKKGANVISMPEIQDSVELEDIIEDLWNQGVDAVRLGDWSSKGSEEELAILNPAAVFTYQNPTTFPVFQKKKFEALTKQAIDDIYTGAIETAKRLDEIRRLPTREEKDAELAKIQDIRFSRGGGIDHADLGTVGENDRPSSQWDAPLASSWDDKIYKLQDKNIDTKRVIQAIKKMAGDIQDKLNVYLQEELYHGRTAKRVLEFGRGELNPALDELAAMGYSIEDLEEYMHARHAPEANVVLAARNPTREMIDTARAEAKAEIKRLKAELSVDGLGKDEAKALKAELKKAEAKLKSWTGVAAFKGTEEERNSLSGMKTEEAEAYFRNLPAEDAAKLKKVAEKMDAIMAETSNMMVAYHLESQETVDGWNAMYRHYIPLHREGKDDGSMGTGQGFSIKGREVKGRTGSRRKVVNIVAHIAEAREKTIVRGEKNRVAQALVGLVTAYPNADFWKTGAPPSERVFDRATGKVKNQVNPAYKSLPNVVMAKVIGEDGKVKEVAVTFNENDERAVRMAGALKNLDTPQVEGWLGTVAKATRYFAAVNTQFNPIFGAVNLVRDVQGAMINLGATPLADQKMKIARDSVDALAGIYRDIRATRRGEVGSSRWSELYEQFQHDGGQTGFRNLFETTDDRSRELKDRVSPTDWAKTPLGRIMSANGKLTKQAQWMRDGWAIARDWLSDYNETMESATRLAVYKAALDKGMTREQAASMAKNITVNFNRKGTMGTQVGALYAFFNAAMQGTARMGETLVTMEPGQPKTMRLSAFGKKVVYGGVLLGAVQALALAAGGFGDEEPPDFERERNLLIPTGWTGVGPDKGYIKIPMPLGLHVIPGIGRMGMEFVLSGGEDPAKAAIKFGSMMADAFNPIGNAGLSMQTIAPTVLDPLAALVENKDWTGKNIARESFNKDAPMFSQHKDSATFVAKFLAELVNYATGGNEYVGGALNWSPDQIDYLIGQVTGGVGRELSKVEQTATGAFTGDETPIYKVPLLGRFAGSASGKSGEANAFYTNADKLNRLETELKGMVKDGKAAEAAALRMERPESRMIVSFNMAERQVQKLRKQKSALIEAGASAADVRSVDERITTIMQNMNQRMLSVTGN